MTKTFAYDAKGGLTSDGTNSYGYDDAERLVTAPNNIIAYDGLDRLYSQYVFSTKATTQYLYDGDDLIAEYDGSGALLHRYVHGSGVDNPVVAYDASGTRTWMLADEHGSIVALANASGQLVSANTYDEYGLPGPSNSGRFQYAGQAWIPEIGLYYDKARIYSPTLGRFLQTDPIGYADGLNWYAYTHNDPVNGTDPMGKCGGFSGALLDVSYTSDYGTTFLPGYDFTPTNACPELHLEPNFGSNGFSAHDPGLYTRGLGPPHLKPQGRSQGDRKVQCSKARQQVYRLGEQIDALGTLGKRASLGAGILGAGGLGVGALTGQLEVALPGAVTLSRALTAYEFSAAVSSVGVDLKAIATQNPTGPLLDQLNDQITDILGIGDLNKDLLSEALGAAEGEQAACGGG